MSANQSPSHCSPVILEMSTSPTGPLDRANISNLANGTICWLRIGGVAGVSSSIYYDRFENAMSSDGGKKSKKWGEDEDKVRKHKRAWNERDGLDESWLSRPPLIGKKRGQRRPSSKEVAWPYVGSLILVSRHVAWLQQRDELNCLHLQKDSDFKFSQ